MMMTCKILLASIERVEQAMYMTNLKTGIETGFGFACVITTTRIAFTCSTGTASYFLPAPLYS